MTCYIVFIKIDTKSPVVYNLENYLHAALGHTSDEGRTRAETVLNEYDFEEGDDWESILDLHDIISGYFFIRTGLPLSTPLNVSLHCCETAQDAVKEAVDIWKKEAADEAALDTVTSTPEKPGPGLN